MKKILVLILLLFVSVWTFSQTNVIAHRGFWKTGGSAQNSIASLLKADSIGCYGSEFDVWLTKDNQLVVNHDPLYQSHKMEESTLKELTTLRLANGESLPSLLDFLNVAKKKTRLKLVMELKVHSTPERETRAIQEILRLVRKLKLQERVEYITFSMHAMKEFIRLAPSNTSVYYLNGGLSPDELKNIGAAGPDYHIGAYHQNVEWIKNAQDLGLKVNVWTVDQVEDMKWFLEKKVNFITTDDPVILQQLIEK